MSRFKDYFQSREVFRLHGEIDELQRKIEELELTISAYRTILNEFDSIFV